jgi:hypothetical protein
VLSPQGLKLRAMPQSLRVPPTCVCLLLRDRLRWRRHGSDRPHRGGEFMAVDVAEGSWADSAGFDQPAVELPFKLAASIADARENPDSTRRRHWRRGLAVAHAPLRCATRTPGAMHIPYSRRQEC